jgi:hypothetical protein
LLLICSGVGVNLAACDLWKLLSGARAPSLI